MRFFFSVGQFYGLVLQHRATNRLPRCNTVKVRPFSRALVHTHHASFVTATGRDNATVTHMNVDNCLTSSRRNACDKS